MVKSKKPKKPVNLKPEYVLDPNAPQKHKKKKKNAPDRPQPEWMFPPDEENPVLNPKTKSQEELDKDKGDHDRVIKYLQYRSVSTPVKTPPPALLLTLVGAFLTTYGFNSASRLYTTELNARKKLDEWKVLTDQKLPKGFPDLVKLFKVGQKTFDEQKQSEETSSSESEDESDEEPPKKPDREGKARKQVKSKDEETSSDGEDESLDSDDSGDSDVEMEEAPSAKKPAAKVPKPSTRQSSSASTSSSDSDADDEDEPAGAKITPAKASIAPTNNNPVTTKIVNPTWKNQNLEQPPTIVNPTWKSEARLELENNRFKEKVKGTISTAKTATTLPDQVKEASPSSSDISSSSDSEPSSPVKPPLNSTIDGLITSGDNARNGSSSSETLKGTSDQKATTSGTSVSSSSSGSDSDSSEPGTGAPITSNPPPKPSSTTDATKSSKRKHTDESEEAPVSKKQAQESKQTNSPFERVPKDTPVDERFSSNKYKSYDYADRAYQDLSVTKGKGFTKEKNKKKRGSYRGGAIDVGGGKGIKFED